MPLDRGFCQCFDKVIFFFAVSCETGLKGVRFCTNESLKVQCVV